MTPKIVELPQKRVDLIFEIDEGPKSGILRRQLPGQQGVLGQRPARRRRDQGVALVQVLHQQRQLRPRPAGVRPRAAAEVLPQPRLLRLPRRLGGRRAGAGQERLRASPTRSTKAPKYKFGKITVETELTEAERRLPEAAAADPRGPALRETRRSSRPTDALTFAAGAAGFAFVDVRPRYRANRETDTVDVTFHGQGRPARLRRPHRHRRQHPHARLRHPPRDERWPKATPTTACWSTARKNQIRAPGLLQGRRHHRDAAARRPTAPVLQVKVEEQPTGELSFSAGYQLGRPAGASTWASPSATSAAAARTCAPASRSARCASRSTSASPSRASWAATCAPASTSSTTRYDLTEYSAYDYRSTGGGLRLASR